ncbi:uncharacterized protein LOC8261024 [Ricinus communis]|uniref:J domain-containing protein n=1 Tax=Ricinus communis TaxID=3988 RepID=B9T856_RICCO|nr:uncharacterized protein LOC8261024 [Ricinus communis]XP_048225591.1 uncharacterized protein LOC8261024 [Ricinus communis]EEF27959.1 conserved hypothetical protein [Ricinus communis]|eukprot:XP_025015764.1 uncharacterized protein LOC8261024 [Ricinus communis]
MEDMDTDAAQEAIRLKAIAEAKYANSSLKSALKHAKKAHKLCPNLEGLSSMLTALKILRLASMTSSDIKDWYKILQVEPFSHINTIKKQYKKLALVLHPDKNPFLGCEEAFKLVGEGFRVLSDKIRRKEYDMRLRIQLQEERVNNDDDNPVVVETFWTACSRCRLLHQFERKYLGQNLICPSCKLSFEAVEVEERDKEDNGVRVRISERLKRKVIGDEGFGELYSKQRMGVKLKPSGAEGVEEFGSGVLRRNVGGAQISNDRDKGVNLEVKEGGSGEWGGGRLRSGGLRRKMSTVNEVLERSKPKKVKFVEEMMTLAEMQLEARKRALQEKAKLKEKQKDVTTNGREQKEKEKLVLLKKLRNVKSKKTSEAPKNSEVMELETRASLGKSKNLEIGRCGASKKSVDLKIERHRSLRNGDLKIMTVADSDFDDFETDRFLEKRFKKGQVWAIYDDDRKPRRYGLIDEVVSMNPFVVKLSWLDYQNNGDEGLISWGFHVSCGRFKVSRKTVINSMNIFSHVVDCERAAREVYRIYPKKGSVWALYNEVDLGAEEANIPARNKQCYEIAVFLTTYSEMHGLSMAYLEKVDGFNTIYKRREVGSNAIRLLGKNDVWLLSHQIPAKKLSGNEIPALLKECWELDHALLP